MSLGALIRIAGALALATALAVTRPSAAQQEQRVAIVTSAPDGTTARRLEAELRSLGLEVVMVPVESDVTLGRAALEAVARGRSAFAAVGLFGIPSAVEVWISDRVTGKTVVREVRVTDIDPGARDDTIAVGTLELLRASLLEINLDRAPRAGDVPAPPIARELAQPDEERPRPSVQPARHALALALGPVLDLGFGRIGPGALMQLAARWQSRSLLGLEAAFGGAFVGARVRSSTPVAAREADVRLNRISLAASVDPLRPRVSPNAAVGLAEVCLEARGHASLPPLARVDTGCTPAAFARGGLALRTGVYLRLRLDAALLVAAQPLAVRFAGERVARWGAPAAEAALAFELTLPR